MDHDENERFYVVPNRHQIIDLQVFNGYSCYDALSLRNAYEKAEQSRQIPSLTNTTILSNYAGNTVFSLFENMIEVL